MTAWTAPATFTAGQTVSATDMNTNVRDNTNHLAEQINRAGWTSFTPSWTNLTVGNGTNTGYYAYAGKTTIFRIAFTFGTTSSVGGSVSVNYPQTAVALGGNVPVSMGVSLVDTGSGITYEGKLVNTSTTTAVLYSLSVSGSAVIAAALSSTAPFTWASTDLIMIQAIYERA